MCGRYYINQQASRSIQVGIHRLSFAFQSRAEVFPGETVPVLSLVDSTLMLTHKTWGLTGKHKPHINARLESVSDKPSFAPLLSNGRIALPCSGWYEWTANRDKYRIPFEGYMAGISTPQTCAILTCQASETIHHIHTRMPSLLNNTQLQAWLCASSHTALRELDYAPSLRAELDTAHPQHSLF